VAQLENRINTLETQLNELRSLVNAMTGSLAVLPIAVFGFPNPANGELSIEQAPAKHM